MSDMNDEDLESALTYLAEDIMDAYCVWVEDDPATGDGHYEFIQPEVSQ